MTPYNFYQILVIAILFLVAILMVDFNNYNSPYNMAFNYWVKQYKQNANTNLQVSKRVLNSIFKNIHYNKDILYRDKHQPEFHLTTDEYLNIVLPPQVFAQGNQFLTQHWPALQIVANNYEVSPFIIVALLGIESRFGTIKPQFNAVEAIANLAFIARRSKFFTNELNSLVWLINKGYVTGEVKSSWAGALGYPSFMPSTYLHYGVNVYNSYKVNLITNFNDTFASVAYYLRILGWNYHRGWGYQVILPQKFNYNLVYTKDELPIYQWQNMGVIKADYSDFKNISALARVIILDNKKAYLITSNYRIITEWNRSQKFAVAVGILANSLKQYAYQNLPNGNKYD